MYQSTLSTLRLVVCGFCFKTSHNNEVCKCIEYVPYQSSFFFLLAPFSGGVLVQQKHKLPEK